MSFDQVLGQDTAVRLLGESLRSGRVGSGYLFHGPEGVGKGLAASAFARALLCGKGAPGGDACGVCPSCIRSAAESHPGLLLVAPEEGKAQIVIAQIHELSARLGLRPVEGERQVVVLTDAERMLEDSFNALLKTLEEPPPGATLVLVTGNREAIPETIRSRCQAIRFRPLPQAIVRRILVTKMDRPEADAEVLSRLSGGSMTRAQQILDLNLPEAEPLGALMDDGHRDDSALAGRWLAMLENKGKGKPEANARRVRCETLLRVLMERVRGELTVAPRPRGIATRMRIVARAIEDNRLNISPEVLFKGLAVGWTDSYAEVPA